MEETLKKREKTRYFFGELGQLIGEETEYYEPLEKDLGEFSGDDLTLSLPHGQVPPSDGVYRIFKVYEKSTIWIRHREEKKA